MPSVQSLNAPPITCFNLKIFLLLQGNLEAAVKEEEKRKSKTSLIQNAIDGLKAKLEELGAKEDDSAELNRQMAQVIYVKGLIFHGPRQNLFSLNLLQLLLNTRILTLRRLTANYAAFVIVSSISTIPSSTRTAN